MHASGEFTAAAHVHAVGSLSQPMLGVKEAGSSVALFSADREFWLKVAAEATAIATRIATRQAEAHYAAQAEASKQAS